MMKVCNSFSLKTLKATVVGVMAAAIIGLPLPYIAGVPQGTAHADSPIPQGQLVRRGLAGPVVAVGSSSITVGTQFGNVEVLVTSETAILMPGEGRAAPGDIQVGDGVAILLDRSPIQEPEPEVSDDSDDDPTEDTPSEDTTSDDSVSDDSANEELDEEQGGDTSSDGSTSEETTEEQSDDTGSDDVDSESSDSKQNEGTSSEDPAAEESQEDETDDNSSDNPSDEESDQEQSEDDNSEDSANEESEEEQSQDTEGEQGDDTTSGDESEDQQGGDPTSDDETTQPVVMFRTATALKITVIPSKPTRTHERAQLVADAEGKLRARGRDGKLLELRDRLDNESGEDGDEIIVLARKKVNSIEVLSYQHAARVAERVEKAIEKLEERAREQVQRIEERTTAQIEKMRDRLNNVTEQLIEKSIKQ